MKLKRGYLVAFEGIDGTGKSTHCKWLEDKLKRLGVPVHLLREPTNGFWGKKIRELLREGRKSVSLKEELTWFMNDRREDVINNIFPALKKHKIVLMDRYYYSTAAYQGAAGLNPGIIISNNEEFAPVPDLIFVFYAPVDICLERIRSSRGKLPDSFERKEYLEKVQLIFDRFSGSKFRRIDSSMAIKTIQKKIIREIQELVPRLKLDFSKL